MKRLNILLLTFVFFLTGCALPSIKAPDFFGLKPATSQNTPATVVPNNPDKSLEKLSGVEQQIRELRLKLEADYNKFKQEIQKAYDDQKKINFDNLSTISEVNYGIAFVTEQNKESNIDTYIANLRAKQNMARLPILTNDQKVNIENEVNDERTKSYEELSTKYKVLVEQSQVALKLLDSATKALEQKEKERQTLIEEFKAKLGVLESTKDEQYKVLRNDIEGKIKNAKEEQRIEMLNMIIKPLIGIGILLLVAGLLLKSPTFVISGLVCGGIAYIAPTVPFWGVVAVVLSLIGVMIFVDPKTGKLPIIGSIGAASRNLFNHNVSND